MIALFELSWIVVLATAIWVAADASHRDWSMHWAAHGPVGWFFLTLLLWIIFFPVYLVARGSVPRKDGLTVTDSGATALPAVHPDNGFKLCPDCAEPVRSAARKCRFCGFRFEAGPQ